MAGRLALHVLASGSKGNAAIVEDTLTGAGVLVDCGICKRDFFARCADVGFDPARITDVLITHEHTDHTKGLGVVLRGLAKLGIAPTVHADRAVQAASRDIRALLDVHPVTDMRIGESFLLGGLSVYPFRTSHDAASSCGFRFGVEKTPTGAPDAVGYLTDTGIVTDEAIEALADVRLLALEANHDPSMLRDGPYPWSVKRRIASDAGHLSNEQSARALATLLGDRLEQVVAMHLSEQNNLPLRAVRSLAEVADRACISLAVSAAAQSRAASVR